MSTPSDEYPRLILDSKVKRYTQKQSFETNPERFRGVQLGSKVTNPGLFAGTIRHLSTNRNIFFYHAGIAENDIKFLFLEFLVEAGLPMWWSFKHSNYAGAGVI